MDIRLEKCEKVYWEYVRILRQDERVSDGFLENAQITKSQQIKYMTLYWQNYFIALLDNVPAGYVGVIDNDIRICTDPKYQGLGIGKYMINQIIKKWPTAIARVKKHNIASSNLFLSCNFVEYDSDELFFYYKKI